MKWSIPAKTFFLGEYAAMVGAPAIILTTTPCFEVILTDEPGLSGIHPDSPAGRLWTEQGPADQGLLWHDPYHGRGGVGASSAQWIGAYFASIHVRTSGLNPAMDDSPSTSRERNPSSIDDLLRAYFESAWQGVGLRPSGYDVWAQSLQGCVYIHRQEARCCTDTWPFHDLAFILVHTGKKLATHHHLQTLTLSGQVKPLADLVESAQLAFESADSMRVIDAVNGYHQRLLQMGLVASHSLEQMDALKVHPDVLAIKGCGAMGADVLLLLVPATQLRALSAHLGRMEWSILATSEQLYWQNDD